MAKFLSKTTLYGVKYLEGRFHEEPFFLGVNGITGEPVEGRPWSLSFNPALCDVYDKASLEDLVIFLLHIRSYKTLCSDMLQNVISKVLDKISSGLYSVKSDGFDVMSAFNLLTMMTDLLRQKLSSLSTVKSPELVQMNINKVEDLDEKVKNSNCFPSKPAFSDCLWAGLSNLLHQLDLIKSIIKHNDRKVHATKIVERANDVIFGQNNRLNNVSDFFFTDLIVNFVVHEETIDFSYCTLTPNVDFQLLADITSSTASDLETFESVDKGSILTKNNLNNFNIIVKLCQNNDTGSSLNCRSPAIEFLKSFNKKRSRRNQKNESILFKPAEVKFIFQFITMFLNYLRIIAKETRNYKEIIREVFTGFGGVLNCLRFTEIDRAINLKTAAILSKSLSDLVSNPTVSTLIIGMPGKIKLVTSRITAHFGWKSNTHSYLAPSEEVTLPTVTVHEIRPVTEISDLPKIRRSKWKQTVGDHATAQNPLKLFNEGECPVCISELQMEDYHLLICRHTFCKSCIQRITSRGDRHWCPTCRYPLCEYLPGEHIEKIFHAFQPSFAEVHVHKYKYS